MIALFSVNGRGRCPARLFSGSKVIHKSKRGVVIKKDGVFLVLAGKRVRMKNSRFGGVQLVKNLIVYKATLIVFGSILWHTDCKEW